LAETASELHIGCPEASVGSGSMRNPAPSNSKLLTARLRLPPGGRRLRNLRLRGLVPSSGEVCIGVNDWRLVRHTREDALVVPPGETPARFDWRLVVGLPVLLAVNENDIGLADELAELLVAAGCRGCAALIVPAIGERYGWRLYRSYFEEARRAA